MAAAQPETRQQPILAQAEHGQDSVDKKTEEPPNPIEHIYDSMLTVGVGRWFVSMAVLGLAAGVIPKGPVGGLRAAAIYNIAIGSLHFFLPGPFTSPRAATDPRPQVWYYVILALSTFAWLSAFPLMFAFSNPDDDAYVIFDPSPDDDERRQRRGLVGLALSTSMNTLAALEHISLACGSLGACCLYVMFFINFPYSRLRRRIKDELRLTHPSLSSIFCLYHWYSIHKLTKIKWTSEELADAWAKWEGERAASKQKDEDRKNNKVAKKAEKTATRVQESTPL